MNVKGKNVLVLITDSGTDKPYACAIDVTINVTTDFIETSVSGTGIWGTFLPAKNSFTISLSGVVSLDETGKLTLEDLRAKQFALTPLLIQIIRTDDAGGTYTETCTAYISNSSDTGSINDMDTFSIDLRGTGAITPS